MTNILMRNRANNAVSRVAKIQKPRSVFPMGKSVKQTMNCSLLTPILCEEVLPGDTWQIKMSSFQRLMTQITSPLDNLISKTYFFYVPRRLVHENFEKQIGATWGDEDHGDILTPQINSGENGFDFSSIYDYMGYIPGIPNYKADATPLRAYNLIVNEYFKDTDAQEPLTVKKDDSDDSIEDYTLFRKAKMRDYFTNATKNTQKGEPVTLPIGTTAPVVGNGSQLGLVGSTAGTQAKLIADSQGDLSAWVNSSTVLQSQNVGVSQDKNNSGLVAILSDALGATVNAFREMLKMQVLLENDNRGGIRYTEIMQNRYGVTIPDLRIMRPQYLGGTATPIFTTPVIQTSGTGTTGQDTPQGNIAGYATSSDGGTVINASFQEFGWVIGLAVVQAVPQYQQGLNKKFSRKERFDFFHPELTSLGDQAILNKEIYIQGNDVVNSTTNEPVDEEPFAYIGRYDELRYFQNEVRGELRSTYPQTLHSWHYAEKFENLPTYSDEFIQDNTDNIIKRTLAYNEEEQGVNAPQLLADYEFKGVVYRTLPARPVPMFGRSM